MKKIIIIVTTLSFLLLFIKPTSAQSLNAQSKSTGENKNIQIQAQATGASALEEKSLDALREKTRKQIENRIGILNNLLNKIDKDKKINDQDKTSLKLSLGEEINKLAALISSLNQAKDAATIRNIYSQMTGQKTYVYQTQKFWLLIVMESFSSLEKRLEDLAVRIEPIVSKQAAQGKNVDSLQNVLNDMNLQLSDIKTILSNDKNLLNQTTSVSYKNTFVQVRQDVAKVRADFAKIRSDIAKLRGEFNNLKNALPAPSKSPVSTSSATPTVGI